MTIHKGFSIAVRCKLIQNTQLTYVAVMSNYGKQ